MQVIPLTTVWEICTSLSEQWNRGRRGQLTKYFPFKRRKRICKDNISFDFLYPEKITSKANGKRIPEISHYVWKWADLMKNTGWEENNCLHFKILFYCNTFISNNFFSSIIGHKYRVCLATALGKTPSRDWVETKASVAASKLFSMALKDPFRFPWGMFPLEIRKQLTVTVVHHYWSALDFLSDQNEGLCIKWFSWKTGSCRQGKGMTWLVWFDVLYPWGLKDQRGYLCSLEQNRNKGWESVVRCFEPLWLLFVWSWKFLITPFNLVIKFLNEKCLFLLGGRARGTWVDRTSWREF